MPLSNNHIKGFLSLFLVFSILNVYATEFICNINHINEHQSEQHHNAIDTGKHHHESSNKSNDDECCNTSTLFFYSGLNIPVSFSIASKGVISFEIIFQFISSGTQNIPLSGFAMKTDQPPPKIPDIRIFTSSFLI